jgi:hypothetical protein
MGCLLFEDLEVADRTAGLVDHAKDTSDDALNLP